MSTVRRRILRSDSPAHQVNQSEQRRRLAVAKTQRRLETERASLARWMTRLKRAFHSVERSQLRIARLERKLAELDGN